MNLFHSYTKLKVHFLLFAHEDFHMLKSVVPLPKRKKSFLGSHWCEEYRLHVRMVHLRSSFRERSIHLCSIENSFVEQLIINSDQVYDDDFEDYSSYHPLQIKFIEKKRNIDNHIPVSLDVNLKFLYSAAKRSSKSTAVSTIFIAVVVLVGDACLCFASSLKTLSLISNIGKKDFPTHSSRLCLNS